MNWIKAAETLPKREGLYIVYRPTSNNFISPAFFEKKTWRYYCNQRISMKDVEYWSEIEHPRPGASVNEI